MIQPHSVREVPLQITAESLDEISVTAFFMIFGSSDPPLVGPRFYYILLYKSDKAQEYQETIKALLPPTCI